MTEISDVLLKSIHEKMMQIWIDRHLSGGYFLLNGKHYNEKEYRIVSSSLEKFKNNIFIVSKFIAIDKACGKEEIKNFYYAFDLNGDKVNCLLTEYPKNFLDTLTTVKDYADWF